MKFRLLSGQHVERPTKGGPHVKYVQGDVIETTSDLVKRFNSPGMAPKYERIDAGANDDVNPFTNQPAPGETAEEFNRRRARLTASASQVHAPTTPPATTASTDPQGTLEAMTVDQLKAYAAEEEIDLAKAVKKEDMIKVIMKANGLQPK